MEREVTVTIGLKKGISDPEGKNVTKALSLLGFSSVKDVTVNKRYVITLDVENEEQIEQSVREMTEKLLANPVIHHYDIAW